MSEPLESPALEVDAVLAVDFGGTKVEAALVVGGRIVEGTRTRRPTGPERSAAELDAAVAEVVQGALGDTTVSRVGIGSAGPVDTVRGLASPLNVPAWRDHPLRDLVAALVPGAEVVLAIDGLAITLAEARYGAGRGSANVMGMVVSTGVGGGLVLDGRGISGMSGNAGHIGHVQVAGFDDPCACGRSGCLEAIASGPSSVRWARAHGWEGSTGEELAASPDPRARAAIERSARAVGLAVASASALVDLDLFREIVEGAVSAAGRVPLTIKMRKGIDPEHLTYLEAGRIAEGAGVG
ncbi:ROK family protein, partial [Pseudolysinimonas sp.]|uniref:ROK family protein n=1 Tax=Pseudolysinimonas sp. TaxID=2680009 RepID=UPI00286BDCEA